jgi:predicted MFS family arabinose efflux permease
MMLFTMAILLSSSALLAPYLQKLSGYPVADTGLLLAPRGMGTVCAMLIAGRLGTRVDQRYMIGFGLLLLGWSLRDMSTWTPDLPIPQLVAAMAIQGFCMGCIFNPLTVLAFTTLPAQFRGDAAALQALARNIGGRLASRSPPSCWSRAPRSPMPGSPPPSRPSSARSTTTRARPPCSTPPPPRVRPASTPRSRARR